jgi:hypothetical protein
MPCGNFIMCHVYNFGPSLTIIMNDKDQYFEKIIFLSKQIHSATCYILIYGWQSMTSSLHHGAIIMELHISWKWVVFIELQCVAQYIRWIITLQLIQLVH